MQQKIKQKFFVSEIIASGLVLLNCLYYEQDTFHQHNRQCVNNQSEDLACPKQRLFPTQLT